MKSFRLNTCHDPQRTVAVRFDTGCITSGVDQVKAINLPGMLSGVRIAERKERVAVVPDSNSRAQAPVRVVSRRS